MTKMQFLLALNEKLSALPREEVEERLRFYSEMIEDRMEEGLTEEEAVEAVGSADDIAAQIAADIPVTTPHPKPSKPAKSKTKSKGWVIALLILGSPLWFSLLIAVLAVFFSLFVTLWSVVLSLWAVPVCLCCAGAGSAIAGVGFALGIHRAAGIAMIGMGLLCLGLSVFAFFGCKAVAKGAAFITKALILGAFRGFRKKEAV